MQMENNREINANNRILHAQKIRKYTRKYSFRFYGFMTLSAFHVFRDSIRISAIRKQRYRKIKIIENTPKQCITILKLNLSR